MDLDDLGRNWDKLGEDDPFWAVMSGEGLRGNKWGAEEFFATGRREIDELLAYIDQLGYSVGRASALDFGCGPGRLVQALADHFDHVTGVDIAPSMISLAERLNQHGDRCRYLLNQAGDLAAIDDGQIDLVYTHLVLQHMDTRFARAYIAEFLRVAHPDGLVVFQIPMRSTKQRVKELVPEALLALYRRLKSGGGPTIQMNGIDPDEIRRIVRSAGGEVVHEQRWERDSNDYSNDYDLGYRYFARRLR